MGRYLDLGENVHHINGIRDDNRIENLRVFQSNGDHLKETLKERKNWWNKLRSRGNNKKLV